jgi:hypothetical protein
MMLVSLLLADRIGDMQSMYSGAETFETNAGSVTPSRREFLVGAIVHEKTFYAPIWPLAFISGVGPRVGQSSFGLIKGFVYPAPYEELTLKGT